jgi:hypothetical protein
VTPLPTSAPRRPIRLGLRANIAQFSLLVAVNALVGGLLGQERTVLSPLAEQDFHLTAYTAALTYILAFGATKAVTNFFAGTPPHSSARPATTHGSRPPPIDLPTAARRAGCVPARWRRWCRGASRRFPRPVRPAWSTTSTTAWLGACSHCCSPPRGCR